MIEDYEFLRSTGSTDFLGAPAGVIGEADELKPESPFSPWLVTQIFQFTPQRGDTVGITLPMYGPHESATLPQ